MLGFWKTRAHPASATMELPQTLVVIPTLNEAAHIEGVLRELAVGLPASAPVHFVVADGGSTDATPAIVRRLAEGWPWKLTLLHNPRRLQSAAVNLAVRQHGQGRDLLIRCDAHASYPAGFIQRLNESMVAHGADAVVVPMDSIGGAAWQKAVAWVSDTPVGSGGSAHRGGARSGFVDHGHHAAFRMASFCRAGGYDEGFSHNEDAELDCRQRALGSKIYLDSGIRIGYLPRDSFKGLWRQYRNYGAGRSRTIRKHPGSWRLRQMAVPLNALLVVGGLLLTPVSPWAASWAVVYAAILLATSLMLAAKHRSAVGLLAAPAAFAMHMAWALGFVSGLLTLREPRWAPGEQAAIHPSPVPKA